jgi:ElaB/YqjD/DUF883 family membrane-anchored ribosome-binding protein
MATGIRDDDVAPVTTDDLLEDLRTIVRDAEALLRATEGQAGEKVAEVRARVRASLDDARGRLEDAGVEVGQRAKSAVRSADTYAHENPWLLIGVAAGLGFLIGRSGRR